MADATNLHRKPLAAIRCRDAARVEIGCDGTARCAASLDAALDVWAQRSSPLGRVRRLILACSGLPSLTPRAFAAASAWRVRSPIMWRWCSAAGAST